eukprot:jgi/Mesen1/360/ME000001S02672
MQVALQSRCLSRPFCAGPRQGEGRKRHLQALGRGSVSALCTRLNGRWKREQGVERASVVGGIVLSARRAHRSWHPAGCSLSHCVQVSSEQPPQSAGEESFQGGLCYQLKRPAQCRLPRLRSPRRLPVCAAGPGRRVGGTDAASGEPVTTVAPGVARVSGADDSDESAGGGGKREAGLAEGLRQVAELLGGWPIFWRQTLPMFGAGAVLGPLLDGRHSHYDVLHYEHPLVVRLGAFQLETCWWVPLLFGVAAVILGVSHPLLDRWQLLRQAESAPSTGPPAALSDCGSSLTSNVAPAVSTPAGGVAPSWSFVLVGIALFAAQYAASGALAASSSAGVPHVHVDLVLLATGGAHWFIFDRTGGGLFMACLTAVAGPCVEIALINGLHLYHYSCPDFLGIPSWIAVAAPYMLLGARQPHPLPALPTQNVYDQVQGHQQPSPPGVFQASAAADRRRDQRRHPILLLPVLLLVLQEAGGSSQSFGKPGHPSDSPVARHGARSEEED